MNQTNSSASEVINYSSVIKRMLVGWAIGLLVISLFIFPTEASPAWGKFWMIRPLIITPLAGSIGGLCNYLLITFHYRAGLNKIVATVLSLIVFIIGLWLGIVLGLDGTLWD